MTHEIPATETEGDTGRGQGPVRPAFWQVEPEEYLGEDPEGRHYWLYKRNVYRTSATGTEHQSTSWVSCETPFRSLGARLARIR